jgi:hypothetical protein
MTDCYHILGVACSATAAEIRRAYLAKMKALHPDAGPEVPGRQVSASDVTFAYWQLRDTARRAAHDAILRPAAPAPKPRPLPASRKKLRTRQERLSLRARRRRTARLQPMRKAAGALAFSVAALGFVLAFTYLQPQGDGRARAATLVRSGQPAGELKDQPRRRLDPVLASWAAGEFKSILRSSGLEGAHVYGRQCLAELAMHPSLSMLDYCIAFDDVAADWERATARRESLRFFADEQRFVRYRSLSQSLREATVREALLDEVSYFAGRAS